MEENEIDLSSNKFLENLSLPIVALTANGRRVVLHSIHGNKYCVRIFYLKEYKFAIQNHSKRKINNPHRYGASETFAIDDNFAVT